MLSIELMPRACSLTLLLVLMGGEGCGQDPAAELDHLVDVVWMEDFPHEDAVAFLEGGGSHYDAHYGYLEDVDRQFVIPLLKQLNEDTHVETLAFIDVDLNWAWALVVRLPHETTARSGIQSLIDAADASFPGKIETEWGHANLRLSFVDEAEHQSKSERHE